VITKEMPVEKLLSEALQKLESGQSVAIATIVRKEGSGPRDVGAKIVVAEDGSVYGTLGGGFFEQHVIKTAMKALKEGKPVIQKYSFVGKPVKGAIDTGLICGGVLEVYVDVLKPSPRTIVFGVGRVGKPLADLLNFIGTRVYVADTSRDLVTGELFPYAEGRLYGSIDEVVNKLVSEVIKEGDIVFVTHGDPENDYAVTKAALTKPVRYVGLLGSRRKVAEFVKRLLKDGIRPEDILSKLRAPVGADIPAETPQEISVSIVAEFLSLIKGQEVKSLNTVPELLKNFLKEGT